MKANFNNKIVAGLLSLGFAGIGTATAEIYDVEVLEDGTILIAGAPVYPTASPVHAVDWLGNSFFDIDPLIDAAPRSAQRLPNGNTLIADTGNNRVIEVDANGALVIETGYLQPTDARRLPDGSTLIVDSGNHRVIQVNAANAIVWQFGITGSAGGGTTKLKSPLKAERLPNGNTLIADTGNNRVIEVRPNKQIVRSFATGLNAPHAASRLPNGNTMIADTGNHRVVEYSAQGQLVRTLAVADFVYDAELLANGNTLLTAGNTIAEYSSQGQLVRSQSLDTVIWW